MAACFCLCVYDCRTNNLSRVFIFKISATVPFWSVPLIFFPHTVLSAGWIPATAQLPVRSHVGMGLSGPVWAIDLA